MQRRGLACEIQADFGVYFFRFAGGLKMQIHDQIGAWIELPRHVWRLLLYWRAGLPEKKMGVWIKLAGHLRYDIHAAESWLSILSIATSQQAGSVDDHVRVMDHSFIPRAELECADVPRLF